MCGCFPFDQFGAETLPPKTMDNFSQGPSHQEVFSLLDGVVTDSAIVSPHNSFWESNEYYALSIEFPSAQYVSELERIFRAEARHTHLPHLSPWRLSDTSIRATSLVQPKVNNIEGELTGWGEYEIRVKSNLLIGAEAVIEQCLIVMVSEFAAPVFDEVNAIDI